MTYTISVDATGVIIWLFISSYYISSKQTLNTKLSTTKIFLFIIFGPLLWIKDEIQTFIKVTRG